jgi:DNA-binding MarR family transcriptional regulator
MVRQVKREPHMAQLLDAFLQRMRDDLAGNRRDGLRPSHLRLLDAVEPSGSRITALAERLRMTKQGCGQLVTTLESAGLVEVAVDSADRRARVVQSTDRGLEVLDEVDASFRAIERSWAGEVGADRYRELRSMLAELGGLDALPPR